MRLVSRRSVAALVAVAAATIPAFGASPAHADRCEPTEPVIRVLYPTYEEALNEADSPFCYVMLNYVYPRVCDDYRTLLPTATTQGCVRTVNPDPNEPLVVYGYSPDGTRITCNAANFALFIAGQSPAC